MRNDKTLWWAVDLQPENKRKKKLKEKQEPWYRKFLVINGQN